MEDLLQPRDGLGGDLLSGGLREEARLQPLGDEDVLDARLGVLDERDDEPAPRRTK